MEGIRKFRHNVMNVTTIDAFGKIKGGINNHCKDVYFVRAVGTGPDYMEGIKRMDDALSAHENSGQGYYRRINSLPKLQDMEDAAFYAECHAKWAGGNKQEAVTRATQGNGELARLLGNACAVTEGMFLRGENRMTDSMAKNVIVKMLFWYDSVFCGDGFARDGFSWDEKKSVKIAAANIERKQEYLFFYLLTLTGCDVLLLQSGRDIGEEEDRLGLSAKFVLGDFSGIAIPEYERVRDGSRPMEASGAVQGIMGNVPASREAERENRVRVQIPSRERAKRNTAQPQPEQHTVREQPDFVRTAAMSNVDGNVGFAGDGQGSGEKSFEELAQLASSVVLIAIHDGRGDVIGTGSGIMVGREGYILTNSHVASGGKYYSVRIEDDDRVYTTDEIIKYNYVLDLAVIRIQRKLTPIPVFRGGKKLVRGQKVVAIGSPLGLFNSVSDGIISGFRNIDHVDMIQFTAPISHGSSGGAVLNMQGEVIGISTAGFDSGQNINLAVGYECINSFIKGFT